MLKSKDKTPEAKAPAKAAPKSQAKKAEAKDPSGSREIIEGYHIRNRCKIKVADKVYKVICHSRRRSGDELLAIPGGKSILKEDWLAGKGDLGLTDANLHISKVAKIEAEKKVQAEAKAQAAKAKAKK